jgi:hypothetical protein
MKNAGGHDGARGRYDKKSDTDTGTAQCSNAAQAVRYLPEVVFAIDSHLSPTRHYQHPT